MVTKRIRIMLALKSLCFRATTCTRMWATRRIPYIQNALQIRRLSKSTLVHSISRLTTRARPLTKRVMAQRQSRGNHIYGISKSTQKLPCGFAQKSQLTSLKMRLICCSMGRLLRLPTTNTKERNHSQALGINFLRPSNH